MSDERKPVMCRWCHTTEMKPYFLLHETPPDCRYLCETCHIWSPKADTPEAAYLAATRTPPNLPLTLEQMTELDEADAVWVVSKDGMIVVVNGLNALEYAGYEYDALFFARKPTPADIEAARKERTE